MNNKILKTTKIVGALVLAGVVSNVSAINSNVPVEVTVKNAFNIVATPLKFGSIIATNSSVAVATLVVDPQFGNAIPTNSVDAKINILSDVANPVTLGTIKVDGAAGGADLQVKANANSYNLIPAGGIGAQFKVDTFKVYDLDKSAETTLTTTASVIKAETDGTLDLNLGATLSTISDASATVYEDKVYSTVMSFDISY